jgi:hypothetical protein
MTKGDGAAVAERFWARVDVRGPDECWLWLGGKTSGGYGQFTMNGKRRSAHVASWVLSHGEPFPEGKIGCHSCDNPPCVNPAHVWPGTMRENALDAVAKGRLHPPTQAEYPTARGPRISHCWRGHEFTPENTLTPPRGARRCRACAAIHLRDFRQRKRAA